MPGLEIPSSLAFAFTAGVFTFFSPCAYPLLPGYVAYFLSLGSTAAPSDGRGTPDGRVVAILAAGFGRVVGSPTDRLLGRAVVVGSLVSLGIVAFYALLAVVVTSLGPRLLANVSVLELVVGASLVAVGIPMAMGWEPTTVRVRLPERRRSLFGYVGFGVLYAAAAAGCVAPLFLAVTIGAAASRPVQGFAAFGAYSGGMVTLMVSVTVVTAVGRTAIVDRVTGRLDLISRGAGLLLVLSGLLEIYLFLFRYGGLEMVGIV